MNSEEIKARLIALCTEIFRDSGVDTDLIEYVDFTDDFGMDSVTFISLIVEIESEFGITIPDEMLMVENFREFDDIVEIICNNMVSVREEENDNDKT